MNFKWPLGHMTRLLFFSNSYLNERRIRYLQSATAGLGTEVNALPLRSRSTRLVRPLKNNQNTLLVLSNFALNWRIDKIINNNVFQKTLRLFFPKTAKIVSITKLDWNFEKLTLCKEKNINQYSYCFQPIELSNVRTMLSGRVSYIWSLALKCQKTEFEVNQVGQAPEK